MRLAEDEGVPVLDSLLDHMLGPLMPGFPWMMILTILNDAAIEQSG